MFSLSAFGMGVILDAWKSWKDPSANRLLFGEAKKKHTRYMDLRTRFKRQPLTVAERKVVETADRRYRQSANIGLLFSKVAILHPGSPFILHFTMYLYTFY